jgi:hypothetical protein
MINKKTKIWALLTSVTIMILLASYVSGLVNAATDKDKKNEDMLLKCFFDARPADSLVGEERKKFEELSGSKYADWSLSVGQVTELYHKTINEKFNEYIKKSKAGGIEAAIKPTGQAAINSRAPMVPPSEALKACSENNNENYSTYCVALTLYSNPEYGYTTYRDIMSCRKSEIFENSQESENYKSYSDFFIAGEKNEARSLQIYQDQKLLNVSDKINEVNVAIKRAKEALDQTLSAYDQLKLAWLMHKRYIAVYENLIKYRDLLVEIRHFVEGFSSKFVDASTTRCT